MRNVVRRSYLAKVNPITINFEKVRMEIKRKIELIKAYRSKNGNVRFRFRSSKNDKKNNNRLNSKPYYSFFEEEEKLNNNKYKKELKNEYYDEEILDEKKIDSFEEEPYDDYGERLKNYYKNKKVSNLSKYKNNKEEEDSDVEFYGTKVTKKISDKFVNKYNRRKEEYRDSFEDEMELDDYSEKNEYEEALKNEDRAFRKKSNNKIVKNQSVVYLEEDEDFVDNRGDEVDMYKYSPAIINIKNIYPVRGGCGEKNKYVEENIIRKSRANLSKFEEDTELDEADIPRSNRFKNQYKDEDRGIEKFESRNFEKKRYGEDTDRESRRRERADYYRQELSEEEDNEFFQSKRQNKDCGKTIVSINVASKNGVSVEFDKKSRRRYEETEE